MNKIYLCLTVLILLVSVGGCSSSSQKLKAKSNKTSMLKDRLSREEADIQKKTKGLGNHYWRFQYDKYSFKNNDGKCLYAVPMNLLNNPNIFSQQVEKKDLVITFNKSWANGYICKQGFMEQDEKARSKHIFMKIKSKNPSRTIRVIGKMKKGIFIGPIDIEILAGRKTYKSFLSNTLKNNKNVKTSWGSTFGRGYLEDYIFADGNDNFYLGKDDFVKNGLTTKNRIKDAIDINIKLSSGEHHNISLDDTSIFSKFETQRKNLYLKYLIKPKDKSQLIGKDFKVTLVLDFKLNFNQKSNMSMMGISPVIGTSKKFYKEVNFILREQNNWTISGKELLREVEIGSGGKVIGIRLKTWFTGISDKKIYIKDIKEI